MAQIVESLIASIDSANLMFTELSRIDIGRQISSVSRCALVAIYKSTAPAELFEDKPRTTDKCGKQGRARSKKGKVGKVGEMGKIPLFRISSSKKGKIPLFQISNSKKGKFSLKL